MGDADTCANIDKAGGELSRDDHGRSEREALDRDTNAPEVIPSQTAVRGNTQRMEAPRPPIPEAEAWSPAKVKVDLPFCFLTLALNTMPFITHHVPTFRKVGQILSARATAAGDSANHSNRTGINLGGEQTIPSPEAFWEWHVVEGVAAGRADGSNPYSRRPISEHYYDSVAGLSVDGTTQYLNEVVEHGATMGEGVHVYRRCSKWSEHNPEDEEARQARSDKNNGSEGVGACLWRDKIQMANAAIFSLGQECLLMQIDADELWTPAQLVELRDMFLEERGSMLGARRESESSSASGIRERDANGSGDSLADANAFGSAQAGIPDEDERDHVMWFERQSSAQSHTKESRDCAYFHCHFFIGPDLLTVTEDGWGHSKTNEWLRAWVFKPRESLWLRHAPPELATYDEVSGWKLMAGEACITREETQRRGLVFTHYAYVLEEQVGT